MSKYKFRLQTLGKLRTAERDERRVALAEAFRAEQVLDQRRAEVQNEQVLLRAMLRSATAEVPLNVNRLLDAQRYELVLKAREADLASQAATLSTEIERRRLALVEADKEVRVLELLAERGRRAHHRDALRRETRQLDEVALHQHRRHPSD